MGRFWEDGVGQRAHSPSVPVPRATCCFPRIHLVLVGRITSTRSLNPPRSVAERTCTMTPNHLYHVPEPTSHRCPRSHLYCGAEPTSTVVPSPLHHDFIPFLNPKWEELCFSFILLKLDKMHTIHWVTIKCTQICSKCGSAGIGFRNIKQTLFTASLGVVGLGRVEKGAGHLVHLPFRKLL